MKYRINPIARTNQTSTSTYQTVTLQSKAHRLLTAHISAALKKYDLSLPQWSVLGVVFDAEDVRPYQVAEILGVRPPVATALINELEEKKLATRRPHPKDNRATVVVLTRKGRALVTKVEPRLAKELQNFIDDITVPEFTVYLRVLSKLGDRA